ncbi:hypothetical protein DsansV1_C31g0217891 [Dioscorea sansibarensis]
MKVRKFNTTTTLQILKTAKLKNFVHIEHLKVTILQLITCTD